MTATQRVGKLIDFLAATRGTLHDVCGVSPAGGDLRSARASAFSLGREDTDTREGQEGISPRKAVSCSTTSSSLVSPRALVTVQGRTSCAPMRSSASLGLLPSLRPSLSFRTDLAPPARRISTSRFHRPICPFSSAKPATCTSLNTCQYKMT